MSEALTATPGAALPGDHSESLLLRGPWTPPSDLIRATWHARDLLALLARKEFFVRYRRASFGLLWSVGLPLVQAIVLAVILTHVVRFTATSNYPAFIFAGMVVWATFSSAFSSSTTSIVDNTNLSSRVYFPRAILPLSTVGAGFYALVTSTVVLVVMAVATGADPTWRLFLLVPGIALTLAVTAGMGLVTSVICVYFRDMRYLVQAALIVWFYVTPIFYPLEKAPGALRALVTANPVTGPVQIFHDAVVGSSGPLLVPVLVSLGWVVGLSIVGLVVHCRFNRVVADLL